MTLRTARALAGAYLVLFLLGMTWPGALLAARARPFVLGLPFSFFWSSAWIACSVPVLYLLDRVERRHRRRSDD
jgi:Protein of unknown function (DUF3311)